MSWSRPVYSSMVSAISYDSDKEEMAVTWARGGRTSVYSGVSEGLADEVSRAPSVGGMINSDIKPFYSHRYV
jgi:KTSC domain